MVLKRIFSLLVFLLIFTALPAFTLELKPFTELQENPIGKLLGKPDAPKVEVCGYKDNTGKVVIKPNYAQCGEFINGYATVKSTGLDYIGDMPYEILCIDKKGNIVAGGACENIKLKRMFCNINTTMDKGSFNEFKQDFTYVFYLDTLRNIIYNENLKIMSRQLNGDEVLIKISNTDIKKINLYVNLKTGTAKLQSIMSLSNRKEQAISEGTGICMPYDDKESIPLF